MKADQIIYTSCRQGIARETSGFQTFSYSPQIAEWEANYNVSVIFADFDGGTMPLGLPMLPTEEELALFPKRYSYRRIGGEDHLCGFSLCTYIGRDYPENSTRSGNFLGHGFVFPESECDINPGRLIGSPSFMSKIDPSLVRKDERPAFLPRAELLASDSTSIEAIQDFLSEGYHSDVFKQMLACLLNGRDKQYNRVKHIFIHDIPENIHLWIASLMMVFPLETALGIGFSTYEYAPESSPANIVGVSKDTKYSTANSKTDDDYYFDFFENVINNTEFDDLNDFCDFVCDGLMYSYENLQTFHEFLKKFSYSAADKSLKDAHNLSLLLQSILSFDDYSVSQVSNFLIFALKYADKDFNRNLSALAFKYLHKSVIPDELFDVLVEYQKSLAAVDTITESSIVREFTEICAEHFGNAELGHSEFTKRYSKFDNKASGGIRTQFLSRIKDVDVKAWCKSGFVWKPAFIIWLYATERKSAQEFLNKDSFQYCVLENIMYMMKTIETNKVVDTVRYLFAEYKKAGTNALTTLYISVRLSSLAASGEAYAEKWKDEFRTELAAFSEADIVGSLQLLYKNGIEDDITYFVNATVKDPNNDFLAFVKLLNQHLATFFSNHKQTLIEICFQRAKNLAAHYKVFTFAADTRKFNSGELAQMLTQISEEIAICEIPDSHREFIDGLSKYCKNLRIAAPQRVVLAELNLSLMGLYKEYSKMFSSDKKLTKSVDELIQSPSLKVDELDSDKMNEYLVEVSKPVAWLMLKSAEFTLQDKLFSLASQTQLFFICEVLRNACAIVKKSHDYETLIYLVIYDYFSEQNMDNYIIEILNKSGIAPSSLKKCVNKEKTMEALTKYYNSVNQRASESFILFIGRLISAIVPTQESSVLGNVKGGVAGLFKKKQED